MGVSEGGKRRIVIATKNQGKLREMREAFRELPVEILSLEEFGEMTEPVEDGATFEENAVLKARYYREKTGCACIADDSGLEVAVLGNAPGVHSARFAGFHADDETNNAKLLAELARAGAEESAADYRCALAFVSDGDTPPLVTEGRCDGVVRPVPRGTNGFGYDPYFYLSSGKTMAELSLAEKDAISHRGAALRAMVEKMREDMV